MIINLEIDLISSFFTKIYNNFFLSSIEKFLFKYFSKNKKNLSDKSELVLVQCVENYFYFGLFGKVVASLKEKKDLRVEQYILRNLSVGASKNFRNFLISTIFSNRFKDNKWIKLYSSYCDDIAYRHEGSTSIVFGIKAIFKVCKIRKTLTSKDDLLSLKIDGIKVGDLIYDSYLRFKPAPTVDIKDFYLCIVIFNAIKSIEMTKRYFLKKKPSLLLTSYSTYIQHGIAVRIATNFNTKIYSFGNYQSFTKKLTKDNWYHTSNYLHYSELFANMKDKNKLLEESRIALENKLCGNLDVSTAYMKKSAYETSEIDVPNVNNSVVVFLHDFYDSPHVYGEMVFLDFLEWIEFTIEIFEKYNISYFLKSHPNQISDSKKVIDKLKIKYKNIKFISSEITNKQLVDAGMKIGISVYGTVAHELVYMGVPIILCGDNPHGSYNFCFEAKNKEEYVKLIINYKNLKIINNYKQEIESFYFMHNLNKTDQMKSLMVDFVLLFNYCNKNKKYFEVEKYFEYLDKISNNEEFIKYIQELTS